MAGGEPNSATVIGTFLDRAEERGPQPLWYRQVEGRWQPMSWENARAQVVRLAAGLASLAVRPGDRVGLIGPNRPEWVIADYAIQHVGGVVVPIYASSASDQIAGILNKTGARVCVAYGDDAIGRIREAELPALRTVVALHWEDEEEGRFVGSGALVGRGEEWLEENPQGLNSLLLNIDPDAVATIVFTSGTGSEPRGAMLSHRNLLWAAEAGARAVGVRNKEKTISFLPLAHAFERVVTAVIPLVPATDRWTCWFVEDLESLPGALRSVRPTIFFAVPVVWARMQNRIRREMQGFWLGRRLLSRTALSLGRVSARHREQGWSMLPTTGLAGSTARILGRRVLKRVGLGRCWYAVSGAAPLPVDVQRFFQALGLPLQQGWGLTETAALCTVQRRGDFEPDIVGRPIDGVEVGIGPDDEVLVRGPNVFLGYVDEPELSSRVIDAEGFFHTGDAGRMTTDGRLAIVGRLSDVIITAGGRSIAPRPIEAMIESDPVIEDMVLVGDGRDYLTALISLDGVEAANLVVGQEVVGGLWEHPKIRQHVERTVAAVNRSLSESEQIHGFAVLPFGFPDEALTPSMKLKRRVVESTFSELIESLYA